jgi:hypothetical protein
MVLLSTIVQQMVVNLQLSEWENYDSSVVFDICCVGVVYSGE